MKFVVYIIIQFSITVLLLCGCSPEKEDLQPDLTIVPTFKEEDEEIINVQVPCDNPIVDILKINYSLPITMLPYPDTIFNVYYSEPYINRYDYRVTSYNSSDLIYLRFYNTANRISAPKQGIYTSSLTGSGKMSVVVEGNYGKSGYYYVMQPGQKLYVKTITPNKVYEVTFCDMLADWTVSSYKGILRFNGRFLLFVD